jgi:hypothetical protein
MRKYCEMNEWMGANVWEQQPKPQWGNSCGAFHRQKQ